MNFRTFSVAIVIGTLTIFTLSCSSGGGINISGKLCKNDINLPVAVDTNQNKSLKPTSLESADTGIYEYVSAQILIRELDSEAPLILSVTETAPEAGKELKAPEKSDCGSNLNKAFDVGINGIKKIIVTEDKDKNKIVKVVESRQYRIYDHLGPKDKITYEFKDEENTKDGRTPKDAFGQQPFAFYQKTDPKEVNIYNLRSQTQIDQFEVSISITLKRSDNPPPSTPPQ